MERALEILNNTFGYSEFKAGQEQVIASILSGRDTLGIMPTGGGKSVCFQIPALLFSGTTLAISPLISLMKDQVDALDSQGVPATYINSSLSLRETNRRLNNAAQGKYKLIYIAPERLEKQEFREMLKNISVSMLAVDEAHCVSQWGHDFRADYLQLSVLHEQFPEVPRVALTATADARTRREIIARLQLEKARQFINGFDRPNIQYRIEQKQQARQQLLRFLHNEHPDDSGIVYCLSRRKVEETAAWLNKEGYTALPYHAGLPAPLRQTHQNRFLREEGVIVVATIAFGMGIDKPDVRFVAHLDLPKSLEAYYQETGRAGRDGNPATAWMVYGMQDVLKLKQMLAQSQGSEEHRRMEHIKLDAMLGLCEITSCRRQALLAYFGESDHPACGNCDTCITPVATFDGTLVAQKALSASYRTGQRFGVNHLLDILLGKSSDRVIQLNHHQLGVFGLGTELDANQWRSVFRQLVARGYMQVDAQGYGSLQLTEKCRPLLRGEQSLQLRRDTLSRPERKPRQQANTRLSADDQRLWNSLRSLRKQLAEAQGIPPYMIFHDSTLMELVTYQPQSLEALRRISGVGASKLEHYGEDFLATIQDHVATDTDQQAETKARHQEEELHALFNAGMDAEAIARYLQSPLASIYAQLAQLVEQGRIDAREVVNLAPVEWDALTDTLLTHSSDPFNYKVVFDALDGAYSYGILRCVHASLLQSQATR